MEGRGSLENQVHPFLKKGGSNGSLLGRKSQGKGGGNHGRGITEIERGKGRGMATLKGTGITKKTLN